MNVSSAIQTKVCVKSVRQYNIYYNIIVTFLHLAVSNSVCIREYDCIYCCMIKTVTVLFVSQCTRSPSDLILTSFHVRLHSYAIVRYHENCCVMSPVSERRLERLLNTKLSDMYRPVHQPKHHKFYNLQHMFKHFVRSAVGTPEAARRTPSAS